MKRAGVMAGIGLVGLCAGVIAQSQAPSRSTTTPKAPQVQTAPAARTYTLAQVETLWRAARTTEDFKAVGHAFELLLKADPQNATYKIRYADLLFERFDPPEAEDLYQEALKIDPKNAKAYLGLAEIYAEGFDELGKQSALAAIGLDPKLYHADEILARIALEDNDLKKAEELADAALAIDPSALEAIAIHLTIDLLEDKPGTSPWLAKIANRADGYADVARALVINRRYEDAILYYRKAIAANPELWSAHSQLGVALMRFGRNDEAHKELELAYNNSYPDKATSNTLTLMDTYKDYQTFTWRGTGDSNNGDSNNGDPKVGQPTGILILAKKEAGALEPYFEAEMKRAMATYEKKYGYKIDKPVQVEVYPKEGDFAVRVMGLPGVGLLGVTFDNVVAMDGPSSRAKQEGYHWASVLWHELSHVYLILMTNERVPRWFTEGVSVHEETATQADWGDRLNPPIVAALRDTFMPDAAPVSDAKPDEPAGAPVGPVAPEGPKRPVYVDENGHGDRGPGSKKLLPISEIDRGFVHPTYPEQVVVSYFEAGKIIDYIVKRWGDAKLVDMIHAFAKDTPTVDVIREQLKIEPEQFDKDFLADLKAQNGKTVAGFADWTKQMRELNQQVKEDKAPADLLTRARQLEEVYPEYVESGNAYVLAANSCMKTGNKACAMAELAKYSKIGGRDLESMEQYATLLSEAGNKKEAAAALHRMIYVFPLDAGLHEKLGNLDIDAGNTKDAVTEFQVLVALNTGDKAGSHYNLAKAYKADGQTDKAREEAITALETAPEYRPAQKLLLEVSGDDGKK